MLDTESMLLHNTSCLRGGIGLVIECWWDMGVQDISTGLWEI